jgi:hypothetical protein
MCKEAVNVINKKEYKNSLGWNYIVERDIILVFKSNKLIKTITREELSSLITTGVVK